MISVFLVFCWSFFISVFAIPSIIYISHVKNLLDQPNNRTIHKTLTPRLGGVAIFAGLISSLLIFGKIDEELQYTIAGCLIIFFIGVKDDIMPVSAFKKFLVQVLAAGIVLFFAGIKINTLHGVFGFYELDEGVSYILSFIVIIGITNAINLVDGLDGLAASLTILISTAFSYIFLVEYKILVFSFLSVALTGSVSGFLRYNFYKAKIFMGDAGSLVCGFVIAVLTLKVLSLNDYSNGPINMLVLLVIPIFDTARVFIRRVLNGNSPFIPDQTHIHHIISYYLPNSIWVNTLIVLLNILIIALFFTLGVLGLNSSIILVLLFLLFLLYYALFEYLYANRKVK